MNLKIQNPPAQVEPKPGYASLAFQLPECLLITFMVFSITWKANTDISEHTENLFCTNKASSTVNEATYLTSSLLLLNWDSSVRMRGGKIFSCIIFCTILMMRVRKDKDKVVVRFGCRCYKSFYIRFQPLTGNDSSYSSLALYKYA